MRIFRYTAAQSFVLNVQFVAQPPGGRGHAAPHSQHRHAQDTTQAWTDRDRHADRHADRHVQAPTGTSATNPDPASRCGLTGGELQRPAPRPISPRVRSCRALGGVARPRPPVAPFISGRRGDGRLERDAVPRAAARRHSPLQASAPTGCPVVRHLSASYRWGPWFGLHGTVRYGLVLYESSRCCKESPAAACCPSHQKMREGMAPRKPLSRGPVGLYPVTVQSLSSHYPVTTVRSLSAHFRPTWWPRPVGLSVLSVRPVPAEVGPANGKNRLSALSPGARCRSFELAVAPQQLFTSSRPGWLVNQIQSV